MSLEQLEWGFLRFYQDALLLCGDIRSAYKELRGLSREELEARFTAERFDTERMETRGRYLTFHKLRRDDRYLISELAVSAYGESPDGVESVIERILRERFVEGGRKPQKVRALLEHTEAGTQLDLALAAGEYVLEEVRSEADIARLVAPVKARFFAARELALMNTDRFLSLANDMDVYVATSMRQPEDFVRMADDCLTIFRDESLVKLTLRFFDPTISAARCAEDKGLAECLMVKCAKALVYFAGHGDSFGKDSEVAMALSLGKPAIIYCPPDDLGSKRARIFRDVHPLSRLIDFSTGVACGALVTQRLPDVVELLRRVFNNAMEYDLEHDGKGYFRLRERITGSVFRLQTNNRLLRETFWNNYHNVP